jgi:hypothetical protein
VLEELSWLPEADRLIVMTWGDCMKYYKLMPDYENDQNYICCMSNELPKIDQYIVEKGNYLYEWDDRITLTYDPAEGNVKTDILGNDLGWLIISEKLRKLFENERVEGLQYLPVRIKNVKTQENLDGYSVVNICNLPDALDLEHSKYDVFDVNETEHMRSVEIYALKASQIGSLDIFKLKGESIPKFISERILEVMRKNQISGFDYIEVKAY